MQIIIEKIANGFLVVVQDTSGRQVFALPKEEVLAFVKTFVDPSPIQVPDKALTVVKPEPKV